MNFTQLLVLISFLVVLFTYDRHNKIHRLLLLLLSVSLLCEVLCVILLYLKINISLTYTLYNLIHHSLWLLLLFTISQRMRLGAIVMSVYIVYGLINLVGLEGFEKFNYTTFIFGAFLYLIFFIWESFYRLKKEDFPFFLSNQYVLLFAPVLFFFGLSVIFGFKSRALSETVIFGNTPLYTVIGYFINMVYYGSIIFYSYKEKNLRHEY